MLCLCDLSSCHDCRHSVTAKNQHLVPIRCLSLRRPTQEDTQRWASSEEFSWIQLHRRHQIRLVRLDLLLHLRRGFVQAAGGLLVVQAWLVRLRKWQDLFIGSLIFFFTSLSKPNLFAFHPVQACHFNDQMVWSLKQDHYKQDQSTSRLIVLLSEVTLSPITAVYFFFVGTLQIYRKIIHPVLEATTGSKAKWGGSWGGAGKMGQDVPP